MVFNVKKIFRISSDKHGRKEQQPDTDSPSKDDVYSSSAQTPKGGEGGLADTAGSAHRPWASASASTTSLWPSSRTRDQSNQSAQSAEPAQPAQPSDGSFARGVRKKASRIGRGKEPGGYFANMAKTPSPNHEATFNKLFDDLRDPSEDDKDTLGVESTMKYLTSLGLDPESGAVFVALELVQAPSLGEISRKGFVDGWKSTPDGGAGARTLADQAKYVQDLVARTSQHPELFKKVYRYTFGAGKEADQRSMNLETAIEFWRVMFAPPGRPWKTPSHDWTELWIAFLQEKWTRSVNRDMWNQVYEFADKTLQDETLSFWNEDGAWPSVIDDFVAWCHEKGHVGSAKDTMDTSA